MRTLLTSLSMLILFSCNNRSSDNTSASPAPPALAQGNIAIDTDNAIESARMGVRAGFDLLRLCYIGARFLQTSFPDPIQEPIAPGVLGSLLSIEVTGPQGGTATFTWDDLDASESYTSGDFFTISFDDYADQRMVLNGLMIIDDLLLQGLLPGNGTFIVDATLNMVGLSVEIGALQQVVTTKLPFKIDNRIIVEVFQIYLDEPQVLGALEIAANSVLVRQRYDSLVRYYLDGIVHSAELDGTLHFYTNYFAHSSFFSDPTEGSLIVTGANNSRIEITPTCLIPGLFCTLNVLLDADGDEEPEETLSTTWQALLPQ